MSSLDPIEITKKNGKEVFHSDGEKLDFELLDFWQWSASDLINNAARGILAEYLVAKALGNTTEPRIEWSPYDVITKKGIKIEVKSAAYIQSWAQRKYSNITFGIPSTHAWDYRESNFSTTKKRQADVYVFSLLHHKDQDTLDPMNLNQWTFYVISTNALNQNIGEIKSIGLNKLIDIGAQEVSFFDLEKTIVSTVNN